MSRCPNVHQECVADCAPGECVIGEPAPPGTVGGEPGAEYADVAQQWPNPPIPESEPRRAECIGVKRESGTYYDCPNPAEVFQEGWKRGYCQDCHNRLPVITLEPKGAREAGIDMAEYYALQSAENLLQELSKGKRFKARGKLHKNHLAKRAEQLRQIRCRLDPLTAHPEASPPAVTPETK